MRTALPLLFLFLFTGSPEPVKAQNLIPDPGVEIVNKCPNEILTIDGYLEHWFTVRQPVAYFHPCQDTLPLNGGWNNIFGNQEPLMGDGYIAAATYRVNQTNRRSYFGTLLSMPLEPGEEYFFAFHVSMAYLSSGPIWASDNIGILFMTENYLDPASDGPNPNFAHYAVDSMITDTANWVQLHGSIVADSAYTMIAFGNFFDTEFTEVDAPYNENPTANSAYYFFDGFCLSNNPSDCEPVLAAREEGTNDLVDIFPVPANEVVRVRSFADHLVSIRLTDLHGRVLKETQNIVNREHSIRTDELPSGIYILLIQTEAGAVSRKIVVQHP